MTTQMQRDQHKFWAGPSLARFTRPAAVFLVRGVLLGAAALNVGVLPAAASQNAPSLSTSDLAAGSRDNPAAVASLGLQAAPVQHVSLANFGQEVPSPESRKLADWVVHSANNGNLPFMIIDKLQARVFMFDARGQLRGAAAALLGLAVGDVAVPDLGTRKLSSIRPEERVTQAGRFVASLDRDIHGKELIWIDYDSALSLHRVVKGSPQERRAERLASPSPLDNRISYGCINVPVKFYESVVSPAFTGTNGIVYILPETRTASEVFGSYDVQDTSRAQASASAAPAGGSGAR